MNKIKHRSISKKEIKKRINEMWKEGLNLKEIAVNMKMDVNDVLKMIPQLKK